MRRNTRNKKNKIQMEQKLKAKKLISVLTILIILLLVVIIALFVFKQFSNWNYSKNLAKQSNEILSADVSNSDIVETNSQPTDEQKEPVSFNLSAIGDVMCHNTQYWDAYQKETNTYDFSYVFEDIKYYTQKADITIGSLETSFAGEERGYSNYPTFNSPDALAYSLKDIGVDILSTAGNHCLDMAFDGLSRTIDVLDKADIAHTGTYKTQEERDKILIKYIKGLKVAFINYTYGTNGIPIPSGKSFCVNLIDKDLIKKDIETAKSQNADVIIACMHWGTEYQTSSNKEQQELADFLFQNGVNIILGNHPHVLQPMEKRTVTLEDGTTKEGFVIYALGNFICDQNAENTRNSIILNLSITKQVDGLVTIDNVDYVPIHMYKDTSKSIRKMKLLDINKILKSYESGLDSSISKSTYSYLQSQLTKINQIVGKIN